MSGGLAPAQEVRERKDNNNEKIWKALHEATLR